MSAPRDHGGGLDAAIAQYGGDREGWLDLSTGINPVPYPVINVPDGAWTALPDHDVQARLIAAARRCWNVPDQAAVLAAPGASALIARIPALLPAATVQIADVTYNEHAAAFRQNGWRIRSDGPATARVVVHPNNPDGLFWDAKTPGESLTVIDESFCDVSPDASLIASGSHRGMVILKSFGKFWGLAGLRLGFAIGNPEHIERLSEMLGPWPVSGPALAIGAAALDDTDWAKTTRERLNKDTIRMDGLLQAAGAKLVGGTTLFRLYEVNNAAAWQDRLARHQIWSRVFPYSQTYLRLGLPAPDRWEQLEQAL